MKIEAVLKELGHYYDRTRQVGHSTSVLEGANNKPNTIVVVAKVSSKNLGMWSHIRAENIITLEQIQRGCLKDLNQPLVLDNAVMWMLIHESLNHIQKYAQVINNIHKMSITPQEN